ncbi:hypothetical protein B0F90DRAFT_335556 [Multifurca ochricompacta]|uniref:Uncharacterized protein n=1 Tax=Multifurca ochricompacta TaxID=376703 RepID=A0AAD4LX81_9AGAM|nr:hypothetical protein B0F90DRAFT_335556 [Multifurca ochricompacta]
MSGTFQLPPSWLSLFYNVTKDGNITKRVNLGNAIFNELEQLEIACENQPPLGRRKKSSWTRITERLAKLTHVPDRTELVKIVRDYLLEGSFFEPHVDIPRGKYMFGSLVIVFPTAHEGGAVRIQSAVSARQSIPGW